MNSTLIRANAVGRFVLQRALAIAAACVTLLLLFWVATTQLVVQALAVVAQASDPAALERHVRTLSQTFHPRSFDRKANLDAAADYIAGELAGIGFAVESQPFEVDGETFRRHGTRRIPVESITATTGRRDFSL